MYFILSGFEFYQHYLHKLSNYFPDLGDVQIVIYIKLLHIFKPLPFDRILLAVMINSLNWLELEVLVFESVKHIFVSVSMKLNKRQRIGWEAFVTHCRWFSFCPSHSFTRMTKFIQVLHI